MTEEVELRKLQLQDQERNLKNLFQDVLYEHEKSFNERKDHVMQYMEDQINEIEFIDDLEDEVSNVMLQLNKDFQHLVDQGIRDLSNQLEMKMRREIDGFELSIEEYSKDTISKLTDKEIKVSTDVKSRKSQDNFEIQEKLNQEAAAIEGQKKLLFDKQEQKQKLDSLKKRQDLKKIGLQREESFLDMMMQSTDATKKEYVVIKQRRFWFDKKGMVDIKNEDYEKLVKEKRELMKKAIKEENDLLVERIHIDQNIAFNNSEFDSIQDYNEAKRELEKRRVEKRLERFRERTKLEERQLKREQKKVIREIENIF